MSQLYINSTFYWPQPAIEQLTLTIQQQLIPILGTGTVFRGNVRQKELRGFITERQLVTLNEWQDAVIDDVTSVGFSLVSDRLKNAFNVSIEFDRQEVSIYTWADEPEVKLIQELLDTLCTSLNLVQKTFERPISTSFLQKRYYFPKPVSPDEILKTLNQLRSDKQLTKIDRGEIRYGNPTGGGQRFTRFDPWQQTVRERWESVLELTYEARKEDLLQIWARWNFREDTLLLDVEMPTDAESKALQDELKSYWKIGGSGEGDFQVMMEGSEQIFFVNHHVEPAWFSKAIDSIKSMLRADFYCVLELQLTTAPQQRLVWQNIATWQENVLKNWAELLTANGYFNSPGLTLNFRYDHRRERLSLEVRSRTRDQVEAQFSAFIRVLDLQRSEADVYRHPRSTGYFAIKSWRNSDFGEALQTAIHQFVKDKYAIIRANIIESADNENKSVQTYTTFDDFYKRAISEKAYDECHLELQAPRGSALGIHGFDLQNLKKARLELKSSLNANEFPNLVNVFKKNLGLEKIAESREAAALQKNSLKDSPFFQLFIVCITAFLAAFLTDRGKGSLFPRTTLEIVAPLSGPDKAAIVPHRTVHIVWQITREQWLSATFPANQEATVEIFDDSGNRIKVATNAKPGVPFTLPPGNYRAVVKVDEYGLKDKLLFNVAANAL